jgi:putative glycosyl hydrolase
MCGTVSSNGLYVALASVPSRAIVTVQATSVADSSKSASANLTIVAAASVLLSLSPMSANVPTSGTQLFTASVTGSSNTAVSWSLNGAGCSGSACGTLATSLLSAVYTGPVVAPSPAAVNVVATSVDDPTKSASSGVAIESTVAVSVTPASASVVAGATQQFAASVTGTTNTAVFWAVSGAGCGAAGCGTISSGGLYSAPAVVPSNATVIVTATSAADATKSASANATITAATPVLPSSFFGLTVLNFQAMSPSMPFGTTRSWDSWPNLDWSDANPAAGVYNFVSLDTFIAMNQARGTDIIYTFGRTPLWASSKPTAPGIYGPGECSPPANLSAWDNYVTAIATHAAGRIKYWELWNEPEYADFYCGDIPTLVTMAQHASRIIKGIDPTALILSPGTSGGLAGPAWLGTFLSDGAAASVDVIAFHGYWTANAEDIVTLISSYKTTIAANGVATKPMWDTESSWAGSSVQTTPTIPQQVGFVAKDYLLHWSQGISRFVWYAYDGGPTWGGLLTAANVESPAAVSYGQIYRWMVGTSLATPCTKDPTTGIWTCTLSRTGGYTAEVVWIPDPTETVAIAFPAPSQYTVYRNLAGSVSPINNHSVVLGDQPILLETADLPN